MDYKANEMTFISRIRKLLAERPELPWDMAVALALGLG
jgi:hypothetical protein